jgi:hypothetical protein
MLGSSRVATQLAASQEGLSSMSERVSLLKDADSDSDYVASNCWMIINSEFGRMRKETAVVYFKVLSRHLSTATDKMTEKSARTVDTPFETRKEHISNTSLELTRSEVYNLLVRR